MYVLAFDASTDEYAQWTTVMPSDWDYAGSLTAVFYWTCAGGAAAQTVEWNIQALSLGDDDAIDQAWGGLQAVSDTWLANDDLHISAATASITPGGTPAASELVQWRVHRDVSDDDLTGDARLIAVRITFARI